MNPTAPVAPAPRPDTSRRGLLLFAHGARDPAWARPFEAVARSVREADPACRVALAFLEFMSPDLPAAGADMAAAGCTQVDVVPLFLGAGGHVRKDLPVLMAGLRARWPGVRWRLHRAVGEAPSVIDAMARAARDLADADDDAPTVVPPAADPAPAAPTPAAPGEAP